ncbi:hypothetical protein [Glutamicibacter halophytocola]|uniref:hypothetical protein n=1 Tax=Glutamicibacter halophytocola TaxID=1933880 RepID=UPI00359FE484
MLCTARIGGQLEECLGNALGIELGGTLGNLHLRPAPVSEHLHRRFDVQHQLHQVGLCRVDAVRLLEAGQD